MNLKRWVFDREQEWLRLEVLLDRSAVSVYQLPPDEIRELGLLYRSVINDLSRVRSSSEHQHLVPYLNNLVQRVHAKVYEKPPAKFGDILQFFLVSFPQCVRRNKGVIALACFTFICGAILAMVTIKLDPSTSSYFLPPPVIDQVANGHLWMDDIEAAPSKSSFLMTNNIKVAFNAYVGGVFFGIGSLLILFYNGLFAFGGPLQICLDHQMGKELLLFMLPHGVIELTTIFISGGAGMVIGLAILFPGDCPRWISVARKSWESMVLVAGCIILLVIAGTIEGMISLNKNVPDPVRLLVSLLSAVALFGYLIFSGRGRKETQDAEIVSISGSAS